MKDDARGRGAIRLLKTRPSGDPAAAEPAAESRLAIDSRESPSALADFLAGIIIYRVSEKQVRSETFDDPLSLLDNCWA